MQIGKQQKKGNEIRLKSVVDAWQSREKQRNFPQKKEYGDRRGMEVHRKTILSKNERKFTTTYTLQTLDYHIKGGPSHTTQLGYRHRYSSYSAHHPASL